MDMQLALIWLHSNAMAKKRKRDAFADPLDSPEWDGLIGMLTLASSIARGAKRLWSVFQMPYRARRPARVVPDHGVCVS